MLSSRRRCAIFAGLCALTIPRPARAQKPELVVETGHTGWIESIALSSDGRLLASASVDQTIVLWDVKEARELRTMTGHTNWVTTVAFSPDSRTLASGSTDDTIKIWDVATGQQLQTLTGNMGEINSVAFSTDGRILASGSSRSITLWDVATGRELRNFRGHSGGIQSVAFSSDGRILASGSYDKTVKLWDFESGQELRTLAGHTDQVSSVAFTPDGRVLASGSEDTTIKLWDIGTGRELRTLTGHASGVRSVAFSFDGRILASGSGDGTVKLWDVESGHELRTLTGHTGGISSVAFSSDRSTLASGSWDNTIRLWDAETGQERHTLTGHTSLASPVAVTSDGLALAFGASDKTVRVWNTATGQELRTLAGHTDEVRSVAFSPDRRTLASASRDNTVKLWDVASGRELRTLTGHTSWVGTVVFSPDGRTVASGSLDGTIKLWDANTGQELRTLTGYGIDIESIAFSSDGQTLAFGSSDNTIKLCDVKTGRELRTLSGHAGSIKSVVFSPDGRTLASSSSDFTIKLWDVETGKDLGTRTGSTIECLTFSPEGHILAAGSFGGSIELYDMATGQELRALTGHTAWVTSIAFTRDGKYLISAAGDGAIRFWDAASGDQLAGLIPLEANNWAVVAPDGLFDGTPTAWSQMLWRFGGNTFDVQPIESYFYEYFHPGLLSEIMNGGAPHAPSSLEQKDRRQPIVKLLYAPGSQSTTKSVATRTVPIQVSVTEAPSDAVHGNLGSGAKDVRLFRNGSLVKIWHGDVLNGRASVTLNADITVVAGTNHLSAYAFNHDNVKSTDAALLVTGADALKHKGTAYILAVGINKYSADALRLKYAVNDAMDFGETLKSEQAKLGEFAEIRVVSLTDAEANKQNVLAALDRLAGIEIGPVPPGEPMQLANLRRVEPEDSVFIYFAGHGAAPGKESKRFYFIVQDFVPGATASKQKSAETLPGTINDLELGVIAEKIDAGNVVLIIDACQSGATLASDDPRQGPMNSQGLAQLAYEKGMYILAAAQADEAAKELSQYDHGLLTYALVEEGLKQGKADDDPKDGQILLPEWIDYTKIRLPQLQLDGMQRMASLGRSISVAPGAKERGVTPMERETQTPRIFYRRDPNATPLVIARPRVP
jgi:WD40 repeat protein/uncharacterized caspase-like protein